MSHKSSKTTARESDTDRRASLSLCYAIRDNDSATALAEAFRAALPADQSALKRVQVLNAPPVPAGR